MAGIAKITTEQTARGNRRAGPVDFASSISPEVQQQIERAMRAISDGDFEEADPMAVG